MKRIFFKTVYIILLLPFFSAAQPLRDYSSGFQTIFDKYLKNNPYYFSANPAFLKYEISEQLLSLRSDYYNENGGFRRFIDPGNIRNYMLTASGKKEIDSRQIFKGSFSFSRKENNDWQWIFSRDYDNSPFLIGDSTTGNTRLNGILMSAEYSNALFNDLDAGIRFDYEVDQGLKQISPRPTSKNRELLIKGGLSYSFIENAAVGITAAVYDDVETINYREDVGALTTETVIIKFRGYDYPLVFRKKTETRYSYNNGYSGGLNLFYNTPYLRMTAAGETGLNKINVKDDAVSPASDGFYKSDFYKGGILLNSKFSDKINIGLNYTVRLIDDWAENLNYKVLYSKNKKVINNAALGVEYNFNDDFSAGLEGAYNTTMTEINDYYSNISSEINSSSYSISTGLKAIWSESIGSFFSAEFFSSKVDENSVNIPDVQTDYYTKFRYRDILFFQTEGNRYNFNLITSFLPGFGGELILDICYTVLLSLDSEIFEDMKRENTGLSIEYRVKVF